MIVHRFILICCAICAGLLLAIDNAAAHGGVVEEDDLCVIKVNYLSAHFKIYQPRSSGHEQYCEDLPAATESIFVMEYQHDSLGQMLVDFRIIRDVTGKGRFARIEHVQEIDDLGAVTVYYREPVIEPDVYTVNHDFAEEGDFIGIVSATHPETGKVHAAVFPFEVGFTGYGYWPYILGLLVLIQLQHLLMSGRLSAWASRWRNPAAVFVFVFLASIYAPNSMAADYVVSWSSPSGEPTINRIHSWILHVETESGEPVEGLTIDVSGGMPEHDHGLPTRPRVTQDLGDGNYQLDGMRFHMQGDWEIVVTLRDEQTTPTKITISLTL